ncbi:hypothetical protein NOF04DRAFT_15577 [Fusarium oxysporum II5]|uniref:Uncharacterized protein n=2 Tax=Fusarium oxysporum species complex TaxID=171631 RepID=X0KEX1_FUSO5|nr:uncharacterized protein FOIG_03808 [Fusarium odoratissimum NRRL 54006]EXM07267.1 hypothetical protein FOIG_03808 [Fusarium odoratissimum NRRL 54006]KAK2132435.1 hypothetical protein NOF04DRAFT_15577 [Fusarium oxysporum II5]TXC08405.1 hypothetical protein FocTR4_00002564 [Fusarium oxysporum f. sp. cubense]
MIGLGTRVVVVDVVVDAVEDAAEEVFEAVVVVGDSTPNSRSGWGRGAGAGGPNFYEGPGRAADTTWPQKKGQSTQIHGWNQTVQGSGSGSISGPVNKDSKGGTQPSATQGTMNADPIQYFLGFFKGHLSDDEGR